MRKIREILFSEKELDIALIQPNFLMPILETDQNQIVREYWKSMNNNEPLGDTPNEPNHGLFSLAASCPFSCVFCSCNAFYNIAYDDYCVGVRDPIKVVDEIEYLYNTYSIKFFCFGDLTFMTNKKQSHQICYEIIKRGLNHISWWCQTTVGRLNLEDLQLMKNAGCVQAYIMEQLNAINHIGVIRIHTRLPIVDPNLITEKTIQLLKKGKPVFIVIHCNNEKEITDDVKKCCDLLVDSGIPLLSQTALLRGVNSTAEDLEKLFRKLISIRVKPYYLHHCDLVEGTSHFRTTIKEGQELMKQIRGRVSGICQPTYVLDIPNGYGKVPIGPNYITFNTSDQMTVTDYEGTTHPYPPQ